MGFIKDAMLKKMLKGMEEHLNTSTDDSLIRGYLEARRDYKQKGTNELKLVSELIGSKLVERGYNLEEIEAKGHA